MNNEKTAVAPLSAEMDSILDKMEMIAQVVKGDRLPNTAKALSGLIAQARAATVASVEDARDAARYRAWRQVALTGNEKFIEAMQDAMPQEKDEMEAIDWDNAIDAAMSATKEGK